MSQDNPNENAPVVSIGLPVFNGEKYVGAAIESILKQTFGDFELIISDNASTDGTRKIAEGYALKDPRIRVVGHDETVGAHRNYNSIVPLARGEYFKWAAHDDLLESTFLEACLEALMNNPSAVLAYTRMAIVDEHGQQFGERSSSYSYTDASASVRFRRYIGDRHRSEPVFGLQRADVLRSTPLLGHYPGSDWTFLAELALRGEFVQVDRQLFLNRDHRGRSTKTTLDARHRGHWFDPERTAPILLHWLQLWGYLRAIGRAPQPLLEKLRCLATMGKWSLRHTGDLIRDVWVYLSWKVKQRENLT